MGWEWVILPCVGSAIGWVTNIVAIRMLFRPKRPVRVAGLFELQGVLPRRQEALARVVAETVERDLLPVDELMDALDVGKYQSEVVAAVVEYVDRRLEGNLPELLPPPLRRMVGEVARKVAEREATQMVAGILERVKDRVKEDLRPGELVREKLSGLDTEALEGIVVRVARTELRAIEVLGAVLGFLIGVFQAFLVTVL